VSEKQDRKWVKAIGAKLREDLGDCPTLPEDMLRLVEHLASARGGHQILHEQAAWAASWHSSFRSLVRERAPDDLHDGVLG
jgi:hypothetical protein